MIPIQRFSAIFAITVLLASAEVPAQAEPQAAHRAQVHVDRGLAAYGAGRYEEAIGAFRTAYELDPRREILFAWAQAERLSGDCRSAIALYRSFLEHDPPTAEAEKASAQLARCEHALATRPKLAERGEAPEDSRAAAPAPASPPRADTSADTGAVPATRVLAVDHPGPRTPWYTDVLGDVLTGSGIVGSIVGASFLLASSSNHSTARRADTYGSFTDATERAETHATVGTIALVAGGSLIVLGILRYALREGRPSTRTSSR